MKRHTTTSFALTPLMLIACSGGVAGPTQDIRGWEPPPNAFENPSGTETQTPTEDGDGQGNRDSGTKATDAKAIEKDSGKKNDCFSGCSGTLTCSQNGQNFDITLTASGNSCQAGDGAKSLTLACGGAATAGGGATAGTWTQSTEKGTEICLASGADTACFTCL